ncbi:bone morphogenetic protein 4-like [Macrobrachium nipponense]|uniref:bone morphogenetic protein 4-like n=1 Tax=Macrobrachium nipponense TaxID=159736 RepID=UPI0030C7DE1C
MTTSAPTTSGPSPLWKEVVRTTVFPSTVSRGFLRIARAVEAGPLRRTWAFEDKMCPLAVVGVFLLWISVLLQSGNVVLSEGGFAGSPTPFGDLEQDVEGVPFTKDQDLNSTVADQSIDDPWDTDLFGILQNSTENFEDLSRSRRSVRVPEYMWQMYDDLSADVDAEGREYCEDKTFVSFPNEGAKSFRGCGDQEVWFDLRSRKESFAEDVILRSAELHVELLQRKNSGGRGSWDFPAKSRGRYVNKVSLVRITIDFDLGRTTMTLKQEVNVHKNNEAAFDVTPYVERHLKGVRFDVYRRLVFNVSFQLLNVNSGKENLCRHAQWAPSLLVSWENRSSCYSSRRPLYPTEDRDSAEDLSSAEDLPSADEDFDGFRYRRGLPLRSRKDRDVCRRVPLEVNFQDIGWNAWVIAPAGYNAYSCVGRCSYPLPNHHSPTSHSVIVTLLKELQITGEGACCVPTAFEPLQLLYLDRRNKVVLKVFKEMVATKCGCR